VMLRMCKPCMVLCDDLSFELLSRVSGELLVCCSNTLIIENSADFAFLLRSCSNCFGERGVGRWYIVQAKEDHSVG
jgi:hypothetical protein